ncbi:hypothetical protein ABIE26_002032 [Pedobacter africanus]|uniref:Uncharacterized protein n=1 Tax=Pedobacter africanus TaxID=151894 RepID=A0ACC6KQ57_9SPHI|nr:DUF4843 domain-containing protein [Pedobacter africanus]MDR6781480.1 hypothetical protein [Pedobacter africanus]
MRYFILLMILPLLFACKKEKVAPYKAEDGIAFYASIYDPQSVAYSFAFNVQPVNRDTIFFKMRVTGRAADHPRTVSVKAVAGTTARAGIDYILPEVTLPAGKLTLDYPIIVLNSPEMTTNTYTLVAEVAENSDFTIGSLGNVPASPYTEVNFKQVKVEISNKLVQPSYWSAGTFGAFSVVKFKFMIQVTGLTDFSPEAIGVDGQYNLPIRLRNALAEYEAANGPLYDENNVRVTF